MKIHTDATADRLRDEILELKMRGREIRLPRLETESDWRRVENSIGHTIAEFRHKRLRNRIASLIYK